MEKSICLKKVYKIYCLPPGTGHALNAPLNIYAGGVAKRAGCLYFKLGLYLHPCSVYPNSRESFGKLALSCWLLEKVSEYGQEIPQSHTAEQPTAPRGRAIEIEHLL